MSGETAAIRQRLKEFPAFRKLKPRQRRYLHALVAVNGNRTKAGEVSGVYWRNHYNWEKLPEYAQALELIEKIFGDALLADMKSDAIEGQDVPIIHRGVITGYYKQKNTQERIVLVKGLFPHLRESFNVAASAGPTLVNVVLNQSQPLPVVLPTTITAIEDKKS